MVSKNKADLVFLQETYSSPDVENLRKTHWKGDLYFAHGSEHSRRVLILVKDRLNFELKSCAHNKQGRYIILKGNVPEQLFVVVKLSMLQIKPASSASFSRRFKLGLIVQI